MQQNNGKDVDDDVTSPVKTTENRELKMINSMFPDLTDEEEMFRKKQLKSYYKSVRNSQTKEKHTFIKAFDDDSLYKAEEILTIKKESDAIFCDVLPLLCKDALLELSECSRYFTTPDTFDDSMLKEMKLTSFNNSFEYEKFDLNDNIEHSKVVLVGSSLFDVNIKLINHHNLQSPQLITLPDQNPISILQLHNSQNYILRSLILIESLIRNLSDRSIVNLIEILKQTIPESLPSQTQTFSAQFLRKIKLGDKICFNSVYYSVIDCFEFPLEVNYINHVQTILEKYLELFQNLKDKVNAIWTVTNIMSQ
ncbi:hypothetical protein WA158_001125 [Blastocystis sp. Blastoise]